MRSCKYVLGLFLVRIVAEKSVLLFNTCNLILLRDCNILRKIHSCREIGSHKLGSFVSIWFAELVPHMLV